MGNVSSPDAGTRDVSLSFYTLFNLSWTPVFLGGEMLENIRVDS